MVSLVVVMLAPFCECKSDQCGSGGAAIRLAREDGGTFNIEAA